MSRDIEGDNMVTKHGRRYTLVDFTIHGELKHPDGWDKLKSGSVCYVHDGMFSDFASGCFSFEDSETGKKRVLTCGRSLNIYHSYDIKMLIVTTEDATLAFLEH